MTTPNTPTTRSTEKTWWWIAFGVLTLAILLMLGLWN
jgi:hypothetical protein